jgi:hypothetical protein
VIASSAYLLEFWKFSWGTAGTLILKEMSIPKLLYVPVRGRGEKIRVALEYGAVPYQDARLPYTAETFQFLFTTPYAQVPVLELEGELIPQSDVILEWACKFWPMISRAWSHSLRLC